MKKTFYPIFLLFAFSSTISFAQIQSDTHSQRKRFPRKDFFVEQVTEGKDICVVNVQKELPSGEVENIAQGVSKTLGLVLSVTDSTPDMPISLAEKVLKTGKAGAVIVLHDTNNFPGILVAPEDRWVAVNISRLKANADNKKLFSRTRKEFWRGFCYMMGSAHSSLQHCVMKTVRNVEDLDALDIEMASPESYGKILDHAKKIGIRQRRQVFYGKAIREGWAPMPINEAQRQLWSRMNKKQTPNNKK